MHIEKDGKFIQIESKLVERTEFGQDAYDMILEQSNCGLLINKNCTICVNGDNFNVKVLKMANRKICPGDHLLGELSDGRNVTFSFFDVIDVFPPLKDYDDEI